MAADLRPVGLNDPQYLQLLGLLLRVVNEVQAQMKAFPADHERYWYAEGLATKFLGHVASIGYLAEGTRLSIDSATRVELVDLASVQVLTRGAIETLLVFHHIYCDADEEARAFRYLAWRVGGLVDRQALKSEVYQSKVQADRKLLDELIATLRSNRKFQSLKPKQQRDMTEKGKWRLNSWHELGGQLGWSPMVAGKFYGFLSGYTHSSSASVLQTKQALSRHEQVPLVGTTLDLLKIVIADFILAYLTLFPAGVGARKADPIAAGLVDFYHQVGRRV